MLAGGKKMPELDALTMAYNAVQQGASGVDMGRNIFQSDAPIAMMEAVNKVIHENMKPKDAAALFEEMAPEFAAGFLGRMRPDAAGAVMAGLDPKTAYTISVLLAGRNADVPKN